MEKAGEWCTYNPVTDRVGKVDFSLALTAAGLLSVSARELPQNRIKKKEYAVIKDTLVRFFIIPPCVYLI
jgi:hypothetical protein